MHRRTTSSAIWRCNRARAATSACNLAETSAACMFKSAIAAKVFAGSWLVVARCLVIKHVLTAHNGLTVANGRLLHQRKAAQILRHHGIADRAAPTHPAIVRAVHAALIRGPELSAFRAGAEQRRDCAGGFGPAVANTLPAFASETAIQPTIRPSSHVPRSTGLTSPIPQ